MLKLLGTLTTYLLEYGCRVAFTPLTETSVNFVLSGTLWMIKSYVFVVPSSAFTLILIVISFASIAICFVIVCSS